MQAYNRFNSRTPCGVRQLLFSMIIKFSKCFNSRTPCGVRLPVLSAITARGEFQFTHPVRGATRPENFSSAEIRVSIHAPRAGCDHNSQR